MQNQVKDKGFTASYKKFELHVEFFLICTLVLITEKQAAHSCAMASSTNFTALLVTDRVSESFNVADKI